MERLGGHCACADAQPHWTCTADLTEAVRCTGGRVQIDHCAAGCVPHAGDDICDQTAEGPDGGVGADDAGEGGQTGGTGGAGGKGDGDPSLSAGAVGSSCEATPGALPGSPLLLLVGLLLLRRKRANAR
jgi:hypothetical protein